MAEDKQQPQGMPRRDFMKLVGGAAVGFGLGFKPDIPKTALKKPDEELDVEGEDRYKPGWDKIYIRFDESSGKRVYESLEDIKKPITHLPDYVSSKLAERLDLGEEYGAAEETVLSRYNEMTEIAAFIAEKIRHDLHHEALVNIAPFIHEFVVTDASVKDAIAGNSEDVSQRELDRLVSILEKLWKEETLEETGGFDVEALKKEMETSLGLSVRLGAPERDFLLENPEWQEWGNNVGQTMQKILSHYPAIARGLNLELTARIEGDSFSDILGLAHLSEGYVEVGMNSDFFPVTWHEVKHFMEPRFNYLFKGGGSEINERFENTSMMEAFKLYKKQFEIMSELIDLSGDLSGNPYNVVSTLMKEGESPKPGYFFIQLGTFAEKVLPTGSEELIKSVSNFGEEHRNESAATRIQGYPEGAALIVRIVGELHGRDILSEGVIDEEDLLFLEHVFSIYSDQLQHFLVNPALNEEFANRLQLAPVESNDFVFSKIFRRLAELDAHSQEWMSAGEIKAESVLSDEIRPFAAWTLMLAEHQKPEDVYWTMGQLFPLTDESRSAKDQMDDVYNKIDEFMEKDEFDRLWYGLAFKLAEFCLVRSPLQENGKLYEYTLIEALGITDYLKLLPDEQIESLTESQREIWERLIELEVINR